MKLKLVPETQKSRMDWKSSGTILVNYTDFKNICKYMGVKTKEINVLIKHSKSEEAKQEKPELFGIKL